MTMFRTYPEVGSLWKVFHWVRDGNLLAKRMEKRWYVAEVIGLMDDGRVQIKELSKAKTTATLARPVDFVRYQRVA